MQKLELADVDIEGNRQKIVTVLAANHPLWNKMSRREKEDLVEAFVQKHSRSTYYMNDQYQVQVTDVPREELTARGWPEAWPLIKWLSIKRIDKEALHDWRELQEIKNQIVGAECEAVELYPAESRLVDGANQYHIWAVADKEFRFPFGFLDRAVGEEAPGMPYKQRARE